MCRAHELTGTVSKSKVGCTGALSKIVLLFTGERQPLSLHSGADDSAACHVGGTPRPMDDDEACLGAFRAQYGSSA